MFINKQRAKFQAACAIDYRRHFPPRAHEFLERSELAQGHTYLRKRTASHRCKIERERELRATRGACMRTE